MPPPKKKGAGPLPGRAEPEPPPSTPASAPRKRLTVKRSATPAPVRADWHRPYILTPGKDHRRTIGKATFSGKGFAQKCNSTAYWGEPIWSADANDIMAARSIGVMLQAVGLQMGAWTRGSNPFVSYPVRLLGNAHV